jgi:hypothetical protein
MGVGIPRRRAQFSGTLVLKEPRPMAVRASSLERSHMMRAVPRWVGFSMLGLMPSSCGSSFSSAPDTAGPALSEVPARYAQSLCKALNSCAPQYVDVFFGPNDCTALLTKRIKEASLPLFQAAVAANSMKYDPAKLQTCLSKLEALGCKALDNVYIEACENALGGMLEEGENCAFDGECKGDTHCKYDGSCPGTCSTREIVGAACRADNECQAGDACSAGHCKAKLAEGESCMAGDVGCKSGLMCGPDTGSGRVCVSLASVFNVTKGGSCNLKQAQLCKSSSYCAVTAVGLDTSTQTCVSQARSGATCNLSFADMCPNDEYCAGTGITGATIVTEGTCSVLPLAGEACTNKADLGKACAADHVCVTTAAGAVCHKLQVNGKDCEVDADCYSESCVEHVCAPKADCEVAPAG